MTSVVHGVKGRGRARDVELDRVRVLLTGRPRDGGPSDPEGSRTIQAAVEYGCAEKRPQVDLRDQTSVEQLFEQIEVDLVIHCAARAGGIQANIKDPIDFLADNVRMNLNVIESAYRANVVGFINLGSSCMYPKDYRNPLREEDLLAAPLEPTNEGYALSKLVGAKLCEYISQAGDYFYRTLIPCNLFGPGDDFSPERSHLIAAIITKIHHALHTHSDSVTIWGDGEARREFLFVDDLADFLINIASRLEEVPPYLNVGYGTDYTVNDYYRIVAQHMVFQEYFRHDLNKPTGIRHKLLDSTRAIHLGWKPHTQIEDGVSQTVQHYKECVVQ